jgi:PAS domain S-box-containing protein
MIATDDDHAGSRCNDPRDLAHRHFARVIESSDDAIISKNLDSTITSWNRAAEQMFGYTAAEAIGRSIRMIIPSDRQSEEDAVLREIGAGRSVSHFETVRVTKSGQLVPISLSVSPILDDAGVVIGASKIARDISDRKLADLASRRLAAIVESSDDAIVGKDLDGVITSWNAAAERMFGYPPEEAIGRSIRMLIPADRQSEEDTVLARIRAGETVDHFETVRQRRDGTTLAISLTVSPIKDEQGTVIGASKVARDISVRAQLARDAAQASRLKDEFLAVLSHELRTPLHAIVGYSKLVRMGVLDGAKLTDAVDAIERNAHLLGQMIDDILDVSRIVAGKTRLDVQPLELPLVIHNAVSTVQPAADSRGVRLEIVIDPRAGVVSGDPARLQQVVWNLLSNAVKFTPKGGRVQVRVERVNSHVEIVVSDTGVGIAPEFLSRVFDQFAQAETGLTRRSGGLGLGLSIVRHLVEMHGGRVEAASPGTGLGATFRVILPTRIAHSLAPVAAAPRHPTATLSDRPLQLLTGLRGVRVLAVDDELEARQVLRAILESAGAEVDTVSSGAEVLERLALHLPDVLVADVGMPGMDGFDLIEQVRAFDDAYVRDLPAAALTAYARPDDRTRALHSGFEMHLAKPVDPAELVASVATLARRRRR